MNSTYFSKSTKAKHASAARNWTNTAPPNSRDDLCLCFSLHPSSMHAEYLIFQFPWKRQIFHEDYLNYFRFLINGLNELERGVIKTMMFEVLKLPEITTTMLRTFFWGGGVTLYISWSVCMLCVVARGQIQQQHQRSVQCVYYRITIISYISDTLHEFNTM